MNTSPTQANDTAIATIRRILLLIFLLGEFGTVAELLLLGHTEDSWQLVPLGLVLLSLFALLCHAVAKRAATVRIFQATMLLFMISGIVGAWFHYRAKVEFKLEMSPGLAGLELFWEAIKGGAVPPVLAPGIMIQLGLIGLAYTFRHPALAASTQKTNQ